eukprot:3004824-Prymnesium_polylepis.1
MGRWHPPMRRTSGCARRGRRRLQRAEEAYPQEPRGGHGQHTHAPRLAPRPHRTTARSPGRTCRPYRRTGPPGTPRSTRRHSNQRRDTGADGSALGALRGRHRATTY